LFWDGKGFQIWLVGRNITVTHSEKKPLRQYLWQGGKMWGIGGEGWGWALSTKQKQKGAVQTGGGAWGGGRLKNHVKWKIKKEGP